MDNSSSNNHISSGIQPLPGNFGSDVDVSNWEEDIFMNQEEDVDSDMTLETFNGNENPLSSTQWMPNDPAQDVNVIQKQNIMPEYGQFGYQQQQAHCNVQGQAQHSPQQTFYQQPHPNLALRIQPSEAQLKGASNQSHSHPSQEYLPHPTHQMPSQQQNFQQQTFQRSHTLSNTQSTLSQENSSCNRQHDQTDFLQQRMQYSSQMQQQSSHSQFQITHLPRYQIEQKPQITQQQSPNQQPRGPVTFSEIIPKILPELPEVKRDIITSLLQQLQRMEVSRDQFLTTIRNVVGEKILVEAVNAIRFSSPKEHRPSQNLTDMLHKPLQNKIYMSQDQNQSQLLSQQSVSHQENFEANMVQQADSSNYQAYKPTLKQPSHSDPLPGAAPPSTVQGGECDLQYFKDLHQKNTMKASSQGMKPQENAMKWLPGTRSYLPTLKKQDKKKRKAEFSSPKLMMVKQEVGENYAERRPLKQPKVESMGKQLKKLSNISSGASLQVSSLSNSAELGKLFGQAQAEIGKPQLANASIISSNSPVHPTTGQVMKGQVNTHLSPANPAVPNKTNEICNSLAKPPSKNKNPTNSEPEQNIDKLNDVTIVTGVNLKEEEAIMFAKPQVESRETKAIREAVREEEEKLFLERGPLHIAKNDMKDISTDTERRISMGAEEVIHSMLMRMIALSKQRVDIQKAQHKISIVSDVQKEILEIKQAKEQQEKEQEPQAAEEHQKEDKRTEKNIQKEKKSNKKPKKGNKGQEEKVRTNAAVMATSAENDNLLLKWKAMAEMRQQKDTSICKEANKYLVLPSNNGRTNTKVDQLTGSYRTNGKSIMSAADSSRSICKRDLIACLEQDPKFSKSMILYRLYLGDTLGSREKL